MRYNSGDMAWQKASNPKRFRRSQVVLAILLLLILVGVVFMLVELNGKSVEVQTEPIRQPSITNEIEQGEEIEPQFDARALQAVLDEWENSQTGTASVVVADVDGSVLASVEPDRSYFAASIYKLYVAYAGYQQIDSGEVDPDEVYVNGNTRLECLDLMIRESDSPCAEQLWVEIGKEKLTEQLREYGLTSTSMSAITTSAADAAIVLARIARGEDISQASQTAFLASMRDQVYRDTFDEGFSNQVTVYNKIGFRELVEYHDTATVDFTDGRQLVVSLLSERVGASAIAELGRRIEATVLDAE